MGDKFKISVNCKKEVSNIKILFSDEYISGFLVEYTDGASRILNCEKTIANGVEIKFYK